MEVANTMGEVRGVEEFIILDNAEDMVMGVYWQTNGGANDPNIRILDMKNFGAFIQNPLENDLMDHANVDVYPESTLGAQDKAISLPICTGRRSTAT